MLRRMSPAGRARLGILGAALLFSTGGAAIKATPLTAWQVAGLRSGIAALALVLLLPEARRGFTLRALAVAVAYAATLVLFVAGNKLTTSAATIFLQSTAPLYVLLAGPRLLGERASRRDLLAMLPVAAGLLMVFLGAGPPGGTAPDPLRGNALAALAGVAWAATLLGLRWIGSGAAGPATPMAAVVLGNLLAFLACAPFLLPLSAAGPRDWLAVGYLGVFQIGAAYALLTRAVRHLRALEVSLLVLAEPALNPLWAWLAHGEDPGPWTVAGGALILGATALRSWMEARRAG
ncbi:MAG TPA: DMT family transporter [Anaeromyxobacteraceae bacterium]|nr:DMT family transporter [Anaeromyxobacteraceae bacterium]